MPDLLPRVLTALVLIPLVFLGIFFLSASNFLIASGVVFLLAGWEWAKISGFSYKLVYTVLLFIFLIISNYISLDILFITSMIFWILAFLSFFNYQKYFAQLSGLIMLPACWKAINYLCFLNPHPYKLLSLFLIIWLADISAYFIGSRFGKRKLAPHISPGKSIEGALGAVIIVGIVIGLIFHSVFMIALSVITVIVSIIGDLFESLMKRHAGVKDSSKLLPGHGGILDRLDSLISAAPFFALGVFLISKI